MGYGITRRLLTAFRSIEGTVKIQNTCSHLHYLVLENFQHFIGNLLIPMVPMSWSCRAFKYHISVLSFFFPIYEYQGEVKCFQFIDLLTGTCLLGSPSGRPGALGLRCIGDTSVYWESVQLPAFSLC